MEKLLTIIVPSYNMEKYLPKCLDSLMIDDESFLRQMDVVVVNDGSKDRTSDVAHEYAARYPGVVRVVDKQNGNYGSCINVALPLAQGQFVRVLDADDTYDTAVFCDYLRFLSHSAERDERLDLVLSDYCHVSPSGEATAFSPLDLPHDAVFGLDTIVHRQVYLAMHNVAYRTELLREMHYRQTEGVSYTDTEWRFLPIIHVRSARYFPKIVYRYLVGREGQTVSPLVTAVSQEKYFAVLEAMMREYCKLQHSLTGVQRAYLDSALYDYIRNMYSNVALRLPIADVEKEFKKLDALVAEKLPSHYGLFDVIFVSTLFHLSYVRYLRGAWPCKRFYVVFVRWVMRMSARRKSK